MDAPDNTETERILKNYKMKSAHDKHNVPDEDHYEYILIGGGAATFAAMEAIRRNDPNGKILIVCDEEHLPYERPPLSKELWLQKTQKNPHEYLNYKSQNQSVIFNEHDYYEKQNVTILTSTSVTVSTFLIFI